jgi:hypothetical protein
MSIGLNNYYCGFDSGLHKQARSTKGLNARGVALNLLDRVGYGIAGLRRRARAESGCNGVRFLINALQ